MAIPAHAVKAVFAGNIQGGEVFAHSLWWDFGSQPSQTDLNTLLTNMRLTFNSQIGVTGVKSNLPTTTAYTSLTLYSYAGGAHADLVAGPDTGVSCTGTGSAALPNQICMVMSLLTGIPGRSNRGRSYLPGPAIVNLVSTGQAGSSGTTSIITAWAAFVNGMEAGGGGSPAIKLVVASAVRGTLTEVTTLQIDSKLDVQRRRSFKQVVGFKLQASV